MLWHLLLCLQSTTHLLQQEMMKQVMMCSVTIEELDAADLSGFKESLSEEDFHALQLGRAISTHQQRLSTELSNNVASRMLAQALVHQKATSTSGGYKKDVLKFIRFLKYVGLEVFDSPGQEVTVEEVYSLWLESGEGGVAASRRAMLLHFG